MSLHGSMQSLVMWLSNLQMGAKLKKNCYIDNMSHRRNFLYCYQKIAYSALLIVISSSVTLCYGVVVYALWRVQ